MMAQAVWRPHPGLIACMMASMRRTYAYRARFVLWLARMVLQLYLLRMVWTALYAGQESVDGIPATMMIVYLTVAMLQDFLLQPQIVYEIDQRIMRGTVASDFVRPVGFMQQMLAYDVGSILSRAPVLLIGIPVAMVVGSLRFPPSPEAAVGYAFSLLLAYVITTLVWLIVGLGGFWMTNTQGLRFMLGTVQGFLAGAMVPLWFLPDALRVVLQLLPFQGMAFLPVSIFVGQTTGFDIVMSLAIQIFWVVVLAALGVTVWKRAQNKLVVQGG